MEEQIEITWINPELSDQMKWYIEHLNRAREEAFRRVMLPQGTFTIEPLEGHNSETQWL